LKQANKPIRQLQLLSVLVQNPPFLAFISLHTFGLIVLFFLLRLVPALRLALMLAYKPLFISVLYHTLHLITNSVVQQV
jgi:hypothetical protein